MHILISNDDGYLAPGLLALVEAFKPHVKISVVAPDRNRSGASNSLTLENPLRADLHDNGVYCVEGTPTDCVHLAITGLLDDEPDMVFSGINNGANMGDDVLYSGTVAAATEGRFLGLPSVALSMNAFNPDHYDTGAKVALAIMQRLVEQPLPADTILNINIPDVPYDQLRGFQTTRLGQRHRAESVIEARDPRGRKFYWIGPAGAEQDAGEGTDFYAVKQQFVSVTPLQVDLTHYKRMQQVSDWLSDIS